MPVKGRAWQGQALEDGRLLPLGVTVGDR